MKKFGTEIIMDWKKEINKLTEISINAAINAGAAIMEIYNSDSFDLNYKQDKSPITNADIKSNQIITNFLKKTYIPIISEEGKDINYELRKNWKNLWVIDPIDGTKEFVNKNDEFTVNIALIVEQIPIIGVVYAPALGYLYFCNKKIGSYKFIFKNHFSFHNLNTLISDSKKLPLKKNKTYTVVTSRSHKSPKIKSFIEKLKKKHSNINTISMGSSLKICLVAEGAANCYPRFNPTMEWDTAAGHAICMYSGINLIDLKTNLEMKYNRENLKNNPFIVNKII